MRTRILATGLLGALIAACGKKDGPVSSDRPAPSAGVATAEPSDNSGKSPGASTGPFVRLDRAEENRLTWRIRQIGKSAHVYASAMPNGSSPPGIISSKDGKPLLSWRVPLLQMIDQGHQANLYHKFKLDEPWDGPNNKLLIEKMPDAYTVPGRAAPPGHTYYRCFIGPAAVSKDVRPWLREGDRFGADFNSIPDGTSNTIMVVEAAEAVPWTQPEGLEYDGKLPLPPLGGHAPNQFLAVFGDSEPAILDRTRLDDQTFRAMITVWGREPLDVKNLRGDPPDTRPRVQPPP